MDGGFRADRILGYYQLAAGAVDASVTLASQLPGGVVPDGTTLIMIAPEAQAIRYRDDGVAPTATVGMPVAVGSTLRYTGSNMPGLRLISQVAGAVVNVSLYGQ